MPLDLYRRHLKTCPHRSEGIRCTDCRCPVWVDGPHPVTGIRVRRSIGTRDWSRAKRLLDRWETEVKSGAVEIKRPPNLKKIIADYLQDCRVRNLAASTIRSYTKALQHFAELCKVPVDEIDTRAITAWRNARAESKGRKNETITTHTLRKEIEYIRAFCVFLVDQEYIATNPARKVKAPKNDDPPTLPFTPEEVTLILASIDKIWNQNHYGIERARIRARALILLLLYSGLRISDAVKLERWRLDSSTGKLILRQMKTRDEVYVRIPPEAIDALNRIPVESEYFFWSGTAKLSTAIGSARRTIECVIKHAGIAGHPHRFRDTFAVELLKSGAKIRTVQLLLGHKSVRTTERHYSPWVREFQDELDEATAKLKFG